ncbi:hypothetical protein [Nonomuraea sp. NPDC048916]|uniref:hypothetical protein n=1 Tax=Nonomuraea sp. NPDC048916 TaxID=3154232 RepID=UPI0033C98F03
MTASTMPACGRDQKLARRRKFGGGRKFGSDRKFGGDRKSGSDRKKTSAGDRRPRGRSPRRSRASWAIVFVCVLLTYVTYVVTLLPRGYDLWIVLGAATTTCVAAGQVTRTVTLGQGVAGAPRSLLSRMVACWIRAAVADVPDAR